MSSDRKEMEPQKPKHIRPAWPEYFMTNAYLIAQRSTCDRKHVGAVIVTPDNRLIASGYNGAAAGSPSCNEVGHELSDGHCIRTLHAEDNAISFAGRLSMGCTLYVTVIPCYDCAKRIVNVGVDRVVYDEFYASRYGKSDHVVDFLTRNGTKVEQYDSPGLALFKRMLTVELQTQKRMALENTVVEYTCGCTENGLVAGPSCSAHPLNPQRAA